MVLHRSHCHIRQSDGSYSDLDTSHFSLFTTSTNPDLYITLTSTLSSPHGKSGHYECQNRLSTFAQTYHTLLPVVGKLSTITLLIILHRCRLYKRLPTFRCEESRVMSNCFLSLFHSNTNCLARSVDSNHIDLAAAFALGCDFAGPADRGDLLVVADIP